MASHLFYLSHAMNLLIKFRWVEKKTKEKENKNDNNKFNFGKS